MKIWVLKIHVLGEEFMDTMDDAPTCTAPCTGVESPVSPSPPPPRWTIPTPKLLKPASVGSRAVAQPCARS